MKKHEACYWLNVIIHELKSRIEYLSKDIEKMNSEAVPDPITGVAPRTQEDVDRINAFDLKRIQEASTQLIALDIAASALTTKDCVKAGVMQ